MCVCVCVCMCSAKALSLKPQRNIPLLDRQTERQREGKFEGERWFHGRLGLGESLRWMSGVFFALVAKTNWVAYTMGIYFLTV